MKYIVSGDWHIKMYNDNETDNDGVPKKLNEIFGTIVQMLEYGRQNDIKELIFVGDLNDRKSIIDTKAFVLLKKLLDCYPDITFHFLSGNHDISSGTYNKESSVEIFSGNNICSYTETTQFNEDILFVPFHRNMIDDIVEHEGCKILCSHMGLSDAQLSSGMSIKTSLSSKNLTKFQLVLLGHYHKPQHIQNGNTNVYYCGSPIQLRRDERGEEKRFLVVDSETLEVQSIPTTGYRKYIDIKLESRDNLNEVLEQIKDLQDEGNHVRVENLIDDLQKEELEDVNVAIINKFETQPREFRGITSSMDRIQQIEKYLEIKNIPEEFRKKYVDFANDVLSQKENEDGKEE